VGEGQAGFDVSKACYGLLQEQEESRSRSSTRTYTHRYRLAPFLRLCFSHNRFALRCACHRLDLGPPHSRCSYRAAAAEATSSIAGTALPSRLTACLSSRADSDRDSENESDRYSESNVDGVSSDSRCL
jgi:hypothetical protein